MGAAMTLLAGLFKRELNAEGLKNALLSTADTTAMVFMMSVM